MPKKLHPINAAPRTGPAAGTRSQDSVVRLTTVQAVDRQHPATQDIGGKAKIDDEIAIKFDPEINVSIVVKSEIREKQSGSKDDTDNMSTTDNETAEKQTSSFFKLWGDHPERAVTIPDQFAPPTFTGNPSEDVEKWLSYFNRFVACQRWTNEQILHILPLCLRGKAYTWFENQSDSLKESPIALLERFQAYFSPTSFDRMLETETVFNRTQKENESVRDYVQCKVTLSKRLGNVEADTLKTLMVRGFLPQIRGFVVQSLDKCETLDDIIKFARVAETTASQPIKEMSSIRSEMQTNFQALSAKLDSLAHASEQRQTQAVRFQENHRERRTSAPPANYNTRPNRARQMRAMTPPRFQNVQTQRCDRCGRDNCRGGDRCIAIGKICRRCNRPNHFQVVCRSTPRTQ